MRVLIASDIFGQTSALDALVERLQIDTHVVDPYGGQCMAFGTEAEAYQYFQEKVGLVKYCLHLKTTLQNNPDITQLIGFSVGASACWQLLADQEIQNIEQGLCFYGSQIRHHIDLQPLRTARLILPLKEPSFDVQALAQKLHGRLNTQLIHTPYLHGFMNRLSANFNPQGYERFLPWINTAMETH